ncbi:hypothetical protein F2Q69_00055560 [Brassica cretica]|uniref:Uncharacterized protein n=1 Tax=Brassica cretica TaxID=69181 RepID=A0A8S9N050_BRACR|nr:hypothetical protein F2Q69_00055560 [Brassica cretica]
MLVFVRGIGAVCVYDQPGDETTLIKKMVSDRSNIVSINRGHIGIHYDRRDRKVNGFRSCFVRAVKVHSAFPQASSEPVAKVKVFSRASLTRLGARISDLGVSRPWRRNFVCRPETSTLGVVYAAAQLSRPVVPRLRVTYHRGILIDTAKEDNGEDGNFASIGGS